MRGRPPAPARQRGGASRGRQQKESGSDDFVAKPRSEGFSLRVCRRLKPALRKAAKRRKRPKAVGSPLFMQEHDSVPGQVCDPFREAHISFAEDNGSVHLPFADIHDIGEGFM